MKVKLNLSNFNNDFQSNSEISNLNSISDSLIPIGKSGIHIKKKNRGKFTEYCGGKVTDACIRRAKASGNSKLVKRATFAANARKWKHQEGGVMKYQNPPGPITATNESTYVRKPIIIPSKKINKTQLSDESWEELDRDKNVTIYPNVKNDKYVQEFYEYDYAPRFQRQNKFAPQKYVNDAKNIYKNTPINIYYGDSEAGGYKSGGERVNYSNFIYKLLGRKNSSPEVYLNSYYKIGRPVLVHELAHAYRQGNLGISGDNRFSSVKTPINDRLTNLQVGHEYEGSGYTNKEENMLHDAYDMSHYLLDYDQLYEKGTTNTEVRFRLWKELYDKLGRRPTLQETDNYIKGYNGLDLQNMIKFSNAYGEQMYENGLNVNDVKKALINVAQNNSRKENEYSRTV